MKKIIRPVLAMILSLGFLAAPALAESIAYVGFEQGALSGTGTSGDWSAEKDTAFARGVAESSDGLVLGTLPVIGGSVKGHFFMNTLKLVQPVSLADEPVFVSFLMKVEGWNNGPQSREAVAGVVDDKDRPLLAGVTNGDQEELSIGSTMKGPGFPGAYHLSEIAVGQTVLVVMMISDSGSGARADVETWFFPQGVELPSTLESGAAPAGAIYGRFVAKDTQSITGFRIVAFGVDVSFDEFRLGRSFDDVIGK